MTHSTQTGSSRKDRASAKKINNKFLILDMNSQIQVSLLASLATAIRQQAAQLSDG